MRHTVGEVYGVHRHVLSSLALAAGIAGATALLCLADVSEDQSSELTWSWTHSPIVVLTGAWLIVRALRRAVFVTTYGIEARHWLTVGARPWTDIVDIEIRRMPLHVSGRARCQPAPSLWFTVSRSAVDGLLDDVAVARMSGRPATTPIIVGSGPLGRRPALMLLPIAVLVVGAGVHRGAIADQHENAARDARMQRATATNLLYEVREVDDGEGDGHQETWVLVQFAPTDRDPIEVRLQRRGMWPDPGGTFEVLYDPDEPTDADFLDHPKRDSRREDVAQRKGWAIVAMVSAPLIAAWLGMRQLRHHRRATSLVGPAA